MGGPSGKGRQCHQRGKVLREVLPRKTDVACLGWGVNQWTWGLARRNHPDRSTGQIFQEQWDNTDCPRPCVLGIPRGSLTGSFPVLVMDMKFIFWEDQRTLSQTSKKNKCRKWGPAGVQQVERLWRPDLVLVQPVAQMLHISADASRKAVEDGLSSWTPASHIGDLAWAPGSQHTPGLTLGIVAILESKPANRKPSPPPWSVCLKFKTRRG